MRNIKYALLPNCVYLHSNDHLGGSSLGKAYRRKSVTRSFAQSSFPFSLLTSAALELTLSHRLSMKEIYGTNGIEKRTASGHAGHADSAHADARSHARVRHRAADPDAL